MQKYLIIFLLLLELNQIAFANEDKKCEEKIIIGGIEKIMLMENHILIVSKVDTGAHMSSLSATNIKIYKKNGHSIVQFNILDSYNKPLTLTKPLVRFIKIRKRNEENKNYAIRPVINFMICFANHPQILEVNIVDRSSFHYAMLIGNDILKRSNVLVDVNKKFQLNSTCSSSN